MRKIVLITLATTALCGSALASDAFVGQVGQNNDGANFQLNQGTSDSLAIIYQNHTDNAGQGHNALQVQVGPNNYAYTYQKGDKPHTAAAWQEGANNSSVNVQLGDRSHRAAVVQLGSNNSAVNWQDSSGGGSGALTLTASPPQLSVTGGVHNLPAGAVNAAGTNYPSTNFTITTQP